MKNNVIRLSETKNMTNLTVLLTSKCTLKCKLCATYASFQKNPIDYSYEILTKSVKKFFHCMKGQIGILTISGGEPLLYPQFVEFVEYIREFSNSIKMIEIITNGTICPSQKVLDTLKTFENLNVLVDNYGIKLSPNVPKITQAFDKYDIPYRLRTYTAENSWCGGWIDVSDFSDKNRSNEEISDVFSRCAFNNVYSNIYFLINGVAHMCYVTKSLLPFINETPEESINLLDDSLPDEEIMDRLIHLRKQKFLHACKNCNGYLVESEHKVPAEQM